MRINTIYSKWSLILIITALLSLCIINYLHFSIYGFLFKEPFLINVFLSFVIAVEVFTGLSPNRILKNISYILTIILCGCVFLCSLIYIVPFLMMFAGHREIMSILYIILFLNSGVLAFSAGVSWLRLYTRADEC
ncbi:hypothetical protein DEU42_1137 [Flavobacterium sp. AG291]|nr:hypothetical protein DEU42_1137 [Flavobacterium sp. AG291]